MSLNSIRKKRKILFLDRDDTMIKDYGYLNDPDQVVILDGLVSALKIFRDNGYEFIVTTNQSGLTRKSVQIQNLTRIHEKINYQLNRYGLRILHFYSAPYLHNHRRRKPNLGLTLNALADFNVDLKHSIFVGDKWRDLDVGYKLGGKTFLINMAKDQLQLFTEFTPDLVLHRWTEFNINHLNCLKTNSQLKSQEGYKSKVETKLKSETKLETEFKINVQTRNFKNRN